MPLVAGKNTDNLASTREAVDTEVLTEASAPRSVPSSQASSASSSAASSDSESDSAVRSGACRSTDQSDAAGSDAKSTDHPGSVVSSIVGVGGAEPPTATPETQEATASPDAIEAGAREAMKKKRELFLSKGVPPGFAFRGTPPDKELCEVRTDLLSQATAILEQVMKRYGSHDRFVDEAFGPRIDKDEATAFLSGYLRQSSIMSSLAVKWVPDLSVGGRVTVSFHSKRPEAKKFTLLINDPVTPSALLKSTILRKRGVRAFAAHELGTHLVRSLNGGHQPWARKRAAYGIANSSGEDKRQDIQTEEGLATLNTALELNDQMLWAPALLYYATVSASKMSFAELFKHLKRFVPDEASRWRLCARVRRGVEDGRSCGGFGKNQAYFEGAVAILRRLDEIDFKLLFSGRLSLAHLHRVRRVARTDTLAVPEFVKTCDVPAMHQASPSEPAKTIWDGYREKLREMGVLNGILSPAALPRPGTGPVVRASPRKSPVRMPRRTLVCGAASRPATAFSDGAAADESPSRLAVMDSSSRMCTTPERNQRCATDDRLHTPLVHRKAQHFDVKALGETARSTTHVGEETRPHTGGGSADCSADSPSCAQGRRSAAAASNAAVQPPHSPVVVSRPQPAWQTPASLPAATPIRSSISNTAQVASESAPRLVTPKVAAARKLPVSAVATPRNAKRKHKRRRQKRRRAKKLLRKGRTSQSSDAIVTDAGDDDRSDSESESDGGRDVPNSQVPGAPVAAAEKYPSLSRRHKSRDDDERHRKRESSSRCDSDGSSSSEEEAMTPSHSPRPSTTTVLLRRTGSAAQQPVTPESIARARRRLTASAQGVRAVVSPQQAQHAGTFGAQQDIKMHAARLSSRANRQTITTGVAIFGSAASFSASPFNTLGGRQWWDRSGQEGHAAGQATGSVYGRDASHGAHVWSQTPSWREARVGAAQQRGRPASYSSLSSTAPVGATRDRAQLSSSGHDGFLARTLKARHGSRHVTVSAVERPRLIRRQMW